VRNQIPLCNIAYNNYGLFKRKRREKEDNVYVSLNVNINRDEEKKAILKL